MNISELVFASTATVLLVSLRHPGEVFNDRLMGFFVEFLDHWKVEIIAQAEIALKERHADMPFRVSMRAVHSICRSLARLASQEIISLASERYTDLTAHLLEICKACEVPLLQEASGFLQDAILGSRSHISQYSDSEPKIRDLVDIVSELPMIAIDHSGRLPTPPSDATAGKLEAPPLISKSVCHRASSLRAFYSYM